MWITYAKVVPQWPKISNMHSDVKLKNILSPERPGKLLTRLVKKSEERLQADYIPEKDLISRRPEEKCFPPLHHNFSPSHFTCTRMYFPEKSNQSWIILEGKVESRPHRKSPKEHRWTAGVATLSLPYWSGSPQNRVLECQSMRCDEDTHLNHSMKTTFFAFLFLWYLP